MYSFVGSLSQYDSVSYPISFSFKKVGRGEYVPTTGKYAALCAVSILFKWLSTSIPSLAVAIVFYHCQETVL